MPHSSNPAQPCVYAVTPCHNRRALTLRFISQFAQLPYPNKRLVLVDDGSSDGTADAVARDHPWVELIRHPRERGDLWWTAATNLGVLYALDRGAEYILTINDDATFGPELLDRLIAMAIADPKRIVGSRAMNAHEPERIRAIGTSCVFRGYNLFVFNHLDQLWDRVRPALTDPQPVDTLWGNGVLIPRAVFERVGLYDAKHFPHNHADSDLVLRARTAGFSPVVALGAVIYDTPHAPVASSLREAIWSISSDRYHVALCELILRHGPRRGRWQLIAWQYAPFVLPLWLRTRLRARRIARRKADF